MVASIASRSDLGSSLSSARAGEAALGLLSFVAHVFSTHGPFGFPLATRHGVFLFS
jgi:hypothetical protein